MLGKQVLVKRRKIGALPRILLIADALSRLIQHAKRDRSYKGIMVISYEELSHILFMDDVVMMGEGTWENFKGDEHILDLYKKATGMHINVEKSILSKNSIPKMKKNRLITEVPYILKPLSEGFKY